MGALLFLLTILLSGASEQTLRDPRRERLDRVLDGVLRSLVRPEARQAPRVTSLGEAPRDGRDRDPRDHERAGNVGE
jgi:hypothetical protein